MTEAGLDRSQQAAQALSNGEYELAAQLYEQLIEAEPNIKAHYWFLGLALLLQGQETEAQTTWMLAVMDGEPDQIEQWSAELTDVLSAAADRQTAAQNFPIAWTIRQHLRELCPQNLTNLIQLILLSIKLDQFDPSELIAWEVVPLLRSPAGAAIASASRREFLQTTLNAAPLEPTLVELAAACLEAEPDLAPVLHLLMKKAIEIAHELHCPALAIRYAELCLQFCPQDLTVLSHLSEFHQNAGNYEAGIETARECCILARSLPDQVFSACLLLRVLSRGGNYWEEIFAVAAVQNSLFLELAAANIVPQDQDTTLRLLMSTFFQPYLFDDLAKNRLIQNRVFELCQAGVRTYAAAPVQKFEQGHLQRRQVQNRDRPLRIGYLSHCLRQHSVGWLARWLIQYHDRSQFQLYGYFWNYQFRNPDPLQMWYLEQMDVARKFGREALPIAEQIYQDEVDILIDLDSVTSDICSEVMALKPAPVQATWLGWDASGLPAIDYFIADPYVLPDFAEQHYSEKIVRLPQTYIAVDGFEVGVPTLRRDELGIPADAIMYLSAQSSYKRHPDTVRLQMQILKAVPNSYFLIKGLLDEQSIQAYFYEMAAAEGVERDRLRFLPKVAREEVHRANLAIADVVLDTYPYNGATTTLETLWMGLPLVTRVGEHFSSRNSYTMMVNAGISEGIAWSAEEYLEWGIRFGKSPELRQQVAWKLRRSRQTAPLWNARKFTRELESAYQQMWQAYLST
jgi:predicted O-linked N-acetylglucosamine transferase (SPINDLY family)